MRQLRLLLLLGVLWLTAMATAAQVGPPPPPPPAGPPAGGNPGGVPPRTATPPKQGEQKDEEPPSQRGQSHRDETDPFLKYAEDVVLRITQLDLRDFPTVRLFATAQDNQGISIRTLQEPDFVLKENKTEVTDLHFANRDQLNLPLAIMFVVDISGSMQENNAIELEKEAIRQFAGQLGPKDRVSLITFSDAAIPEVPLTVDKDRLLRAVDTMAPWGQTALWDAIYRGMEDMLADDQPARRAMIVLSDGGDNRSVETPQTISQFYSDKAQAENKGFSVYCLGLGNQVERGALGSIATVTSGLYVDSPTAQDLADVYEDILHQIQSEYLLEYTSPTAANPGQIIDIELGLNNVRSFTPAVYTYRSPGLAAALGRALWPGLITIGVLLAILIATTIFKIARQSWITVMVTPLEGRDYSLGSDTLDIGRSEVCAIRVGMDSSLAPVHASLKETRDGWELEAYDPASPILFGKQRLARKLLRNGDAFVLGHTSFVFNERIERPGVGFGESVELAFAGTGGGPSTVTLGGLPPIAPAGPPLAPILPTGGVPAAMVATSGPHNGTSFGLQQGDNVIGRTEGQILLPRDTQVSRKHCTVTLTGDSATVTDHGSTNGTRVNGRPLQAGMAQPVAAGDLLQIGSGEFRLE